MSTVQLFDHYQQCDLSLFTQTNRFQAGLFNSAPSAGASSFSGLTGEVSGGGYARISASALTPSQTITAAASWGNTWSTVNFNVGDIIHNGSFLYQAVLSGTSAGSAPTTTTKGQLDTNATTGGVPQFICVGDSVTILTTASSFVWTASGGSIGPAQYFAIGDVTNDKPLGWIDFGTPETATSGNTLTVTPDSTYGLAWFLPR